MRTFHKWSSDWSHTRLHYTSPCQTPVQDNVCSADLLGGGWLSCRQQPHHDPVSLSTGLLQHSEHGHDHQQPLQLHSSGLVQPLCGLCGDCRHSLPHLSLYYYWYGGLAGWVSRGQQMLGSKMGKLAKTKQAGLENTFIKLFFFSLKWGSEMSNVQSNLQLVYIYTQIVRQKIGKNQLFIKKIPLRIVGFSDQ